MNIIITGCSRGIGFELVKLFSKEHEVYCLSRNTQTLIELAKDYPTIHYLQFDISKSSLDDLKGYLPKEGANILVNNAGYLVNAPFDQIKEVDLLAMYEANVLGPFRLMQMLIPDLIKGKAHVINIGSMGGVQGSVKFPGLSAYSSSKGAMAILTECLAEEYKEMKVKFNCLALGAVQTEMLKEAFPNYVAPISPIEMAEYIVEFALSGSHFINGKVISVSNSTP